MDYLQEQIKNIHSKLGLLNIDTFEKARLDLQKKGYTIQDYITNGEQAEVFKGYSDTLKRDCAIRLSANTVEGYQSLLKELETIKHIKLPLNIVELLAVEYFEDIQICAHILELCQFSLEDEMQTLRNNKTWYNMEQQYFIIFSLCDALNEIQSYEILHFDIKPSNILKTMKGEYVLSDFGMSKRIAKNESQINKAYGFSFKYISPEQYQNLQDQIEQKEYLTPISYSSDLYSMSLLFLQILGFTVDFLFNYYIKEQQFQHINLEDDQKMIFESFRKSLLVQDPNSRIETLKLHQFLLIVLDIKNKTFLEQYQNKIEKILNQNKYGTSQNLYFSSYLQHEYSLTHLMISQILQCQFSESKSLCFIGESFFRLGQINKALEFYHHSLEMRKSLYSGNDPHIVASLNHLGKCYKTLGKVDQALEYYEKSLEMRKSLYSGNHPDIAKSLNNVGSCYKTLGKSDKALEYFQQSSEMRKSLYLQNHPDIAESLNDLGLCYETLGKADKALEYYQQSLEMYKSVYSGNHPHIATSLNNLGSCYETLGKADKALEYYQQSLEMRKSLYQGNHPDITESLNNIGLCYEILGKTNKSLEYYQQSLEMRKSLYQGNHPDIAKSLNNVGSCYKTLGKSDKALEYFQQSSEMRNSLYLQNHPDIAESLNNIGLCYEILGKADKSLEYYLQYLEMNKSIFSSNHPNIATSLNAFGQGYYNLGKHDKTLESNSLIENIQSKKLTNKVTQSLLNKYLQEPNREQNDDELIEKLEKCLPLHIDLVKKQKLEITKIKNIKQNGFLYQVVDDLNDHYALKLFEDCEIYNKQKKVFEKIKKTDGIVEIVKSFEQDQYFGILMNECKGSFEQIKYIQKLSDFKIIDMIKQLTLTFYEFHQRGILLIDLKPSNILFDNDNKLQVYLGQNWIFESTNNYQNKRFQQSLYDVISDYNFKKNNKIQNDVSVQKNYQILGKIICFLIEKFQNNQKFNLKKLELDQKEYVKQICIQFPELIQIISQFLNEEQINIDKIIDKLEQIKEGVEQKIFQLDVKFLDTSINFMFDIYFSNNNIVDEIKLLIQNYNLSQEQFIQNQQQIFISEIIKQLKQMNGEEFNLSYQDVIFYINYLCFMNNKLNYSQKKSLDAVNSEFQFNIEKILQNFNKFDYFSSHPDFPLYLIQKQYKNRNINIKYTKNLNNKKLNSVMGHFLFSGMVDETYYVDYKLDDNDTLNFQIVQQNPIILRNKLNELGLQDYMILNIYEGSTCCHLFLSKEIQNKIKNRKKEIYHSFLDGQALNISDILKPDYNIYYTVDHFDFKPQFRGFIEVREQKYGREIRKQEKQPHNFPVGYYGVAINVGVYSDQQFLKDTCEEGVWMTAFHGTKPINQGKTHIRDIILNGYTISQYSGDQMANKMCRYNKKNIGENNIYFANTIRTDVQRQRNNLGGAEVYTEPFKINGNEYCIIFMCRLNPKSVYSPEIRPAYFLVKDNVNVRPYKILIMETIKDEQEINFSFQDKNIRKRSNQKHYENETLEVLLKKLKQSKIYNPDKQRLQILLSNQSVIELDRENDKQKTFKQLIQGKTLEIKDFDPHKNIKTYCGKIVSK